MTTITHPELVRTLCKPGRDIANGLTAAEADLWHHATGVAGECGELLEPLMDYPLGLDRENLVEELGDLEFYLEGMRQNLWIERSETLPENFAVFEGMGVFTSGAKLSISGAKLLDLAKKVAIYQKEADRQTFIDELRVFEGHLEGIRRNLSITREEVLAGNIAKLQVRYAAGSYSNEQAQNRADKTGEAA